MKTMRSKLFLIALAAGAVACTGGKAADGDPDDVVKADDAKADDAKADDAKADDAGAAAEAEAKDKAKDDTKEPGGAKGVAGDKIALGRLANDDLRKMIHDEIDKRVTKHSAAGDGEEATELGDGETFQYTVVKLSRGLDDVSGDPTEVPDGVEVEVNGWYKRSLAQKDAKDAEVQCMSFDTYTHLVKKAGRWVVPTDYQVVFNREDSEDCY